MYNQAKLAYLNIDKYIDDEVKKPAGKSSGLLGRNKDMQEAEVDTDPAARMAKVVKRIRDARKEIKNAKETG